MSEMIPDGTMTASDWVGVAAEMTDYLERLLNGNLTKIPQATLEDAESFFNQALWGIEEKPGSTPAPHMAAISNSCIAEEIRRIISGKIKTPPEICEKIRAHLKCLRDILNGHPDKTAVTELKEFFQKLWDTGNSEREAKYFRQSDED